MIASTPKSYAERLDTFVRTALFTDEELIDLKYGEVPPGTVFAEGVAGRMGFHPERLAAAKEPLRALLREMLPDSFLKQHGGGCSFLALCNDRTDEQWTDLHRTMDVLVMISMACGLASFCAPRQMWPMLPGGMPYVVFDLETA